MACSEKLTIVHQQENATAIFHAHFNHTSMPMLQFCMHPIQAFSNLIDNLETVAMLQQGSSQAGNGTQFTSNDKRCFVLPESAC